MGHRQPHSDRTSPFHLRLRAHAGQYELASKLQSWAPYSELILLDGITEGAACTVLTASELIDNDDQLMIANSDQYVDINIDDYLTASRTGGLDGLIMTMRADDPKWSFVTCDAQGRVTTVVEKQVVSNEATVGIYNFARGSDFVTASKEMIARNERVNGEFYVAPVYNELISQNKYFGIFNIGIEGQGMHGLGTPADLARFLEHPVSQKHAEA